jgi:hypothetical protein
MSERDAHGMIWPDKHDYSRGNWPVCPNCDELLCIQAKPAPDGSEVLRIECPTCCVRGPAAGSEELAKELYWRQQKVDRFVRAL